MKHTIKEYVSKWALDEGVTTEEMEFRRLAQMIVAEIPLEELRKIFDLIKYDQTLMMTREYPEGHIPSNEDLLDPRFSDFVFFEATLKTHDDYEQEK